MSEPATAAVTVVIPTVGRPALLAATLASIRACATLPAEVLVIDQSGGDEVADVVASSGLEQARSIPSERRGIGAAANAGINAAAHDVFLMVHDDCTVDPGWIDAALAAMREAPGGIASGQVLPVGPDPRAVPSSIAFDEVRDFTGTTEAGALYPANMVGPRDAILALGGFDEVIGPAAEDCDLCYRWLRAGGTMRQVPAMVVHHRDWRPREELPGLYVGYYRGLGMFYAKHLRAGDRGMLRLIAFEGVSWVRSLLSRLFHGTPRWADPRRGAFAGLPRGLRDGWRAFR